MTFYSNLFTNDLEVEDLFPLRGQFSRVFDNHEEGWDLWIIADKVKKAAFDMGGAKASEPDGFQLFFFQSQWNTVGNVVIKFAQRILDVN